LSESQAYRIDHILGFFRIWEIPASGVSGLLGRFSPAVPLQRYELEREGVWDFHRLIKPYIRSHLLEQKLGGSWREVVRRAAVAAVVVVCSCLCSFSFSYSW
jgi:4-alpha-glucanotransferase